jgi:predicted metal-dependent hydrolase
MTVQVHIQQQDRKSLALRATSEGIVALIPHHLDPDAPTVRRFIERGLKRLEKLSELSPPPEALAPQDLHDVVAVWSERVGVEVGRVRVRAMRTKWASCSSRGTITLSRDLLKLPRDLVDYVVCHELVHLKIPGHGKGWQALMNIHLPDWRKREEQLAGWV